MNKISKFILSAILSISAGLALAEGPVNLVQNGDFNNPTNGVGQFGHGQGSKTVIPFWDTTGYNFLFSPETVDTTGAPGLWAGEPVILWGPGNGAQNGLGASNNGGFFVAADGNYLTAPITQTINNLVVGQQYNVSFEWAGAQQKGYDGVNTEQWQVRLGNEMHATSVYVNPNHGFSGWKQETFTFTAQNTSQVLSFLAVGTPVGVPPFSLLDGVSMISAVPEASNWMMFLSGLSVISLAVRRRKNSEQPTSY